jgi:hypothetical protein
MEKLAFAIRDWALVLRAVFCFEGSYDGGS